MKGNIIVDPVQLSVLTGTIYFSKSITTSYYFDVTQFRMVPWIIVGEAFPLTVKGEWLY